MENDFVMDATSREIKVSVDQGRSREVSALFLALNLNNSHPLTLDERT
jgi:hypothetical protein